MSAVTDKLAFVIYFDGDWAIRVFDNNLSFAESSVTVSHRFTAKSQWTVGAEKVRHDEFHRFDDGGLRSRRWLLTNHIVCVYCYVM